MFTSFSDSVEFLQKGKMLDYNKICLWTTSDVAKWMEQNNFHSYIKLFTVEHGIDGKALVMLTEDDLRNPPLSLHVLGDIKHLMICLKELRSYVNIPPMSCHINGHVKAVQVRTVHGNSDESSIQDQPDHHPLTIQSTDEWHYQRQSSKYLKPEYRKLLFSYIYMFIVVILNAIVITIVHDRTPDREKYPPLPDLFLDNLPFIPWAFQACEVAAFILISTLAVVIFLHKHRFIILRRIFALMGTVYLLRCVTMLITSLSVPEVQLECEPKTAGGFWNKVHRVKAIWSGFGLSVQGMKTCGDYIFSGHTVIVTLSNFFITEYTPRRIPLLHMISWVLNLFGLFFILASHQHYTIDVFIAFYISSRLFLYYHSLANNRVLRQPDCKRTRIWFPLFSYFESSVNCIVPNEYEWPHSAILRYIQNRRSLCHNLDIK